MKIQKTHHYLFYLQLKKSFELKKPLEDFNPAWVDSLKLILPCKNVPVPKRTMRLPNAPRSYRNGIHKVLISLPVGTPVSSVASGTIVRSDHNYKEVPAGFRVDMLKKQVQK